MTPSIKLGRATPRKPRASTGSGSVLGRAKNLRAGYVTLANAVSAAPVQVVDVAVPPG